MESGPTARGAHLEQVRIEQASSTVESPAGCEAMAWMSKAALNLAAAGTTVDQQSDIVEQQSAHGLSVV